MRLLYRISIVIFCWCIAFDNLNAESTWQFTPADVNALHSKPANYKISYGDNALQFGELRLPDGSGPHPIAIIIHGGCWISKFANIQNTSALADALRDIGIATWNIEYRRIDDNGGGWPGTFEDVSHAADFLTKIADKYSLDLNRVIAVGHSAGGHLALWLGARNRLNPTNQLYMKQPIALRGVIALAGVPDLKAFREQGKTDCGSDVIGKLLGNSPEQVAKHDNEASPIELLPLGVTQILIYGTEDQAIPEKFGQAYVQKARSKGDNVTLFSVKYAGHHEYIVPNSVAWPTVRAAVLSLLHDDLSH